ncbi:MAG: hypothetical protein WC781_05740 [Candidatus Pacearchaeota archaeon]|jgi:hypothetical protein
MKKQDIKTEIVCILNNKLGYAKDNGEKLDKYLEVAKEITRILK